MIISSPTNKKKSDQDKVLNLTQYLLIENY